MRRQKGTRLGWWLSFAQSRAACVVETSSRANVIDAVTLAHRRGCGGEGEVRATFLPLDEMQRDIPRRLWYRLMTIPEWRAAGVDAVIDAVPPGTDPCPLCLVEEALSAGTRH